MATPTASDTAARLDVTENLSCDNALLEKRLTGVLDQVKDLLTHRDHPYTGTMVLPSDELDAIANQLKDVVSECRLLVDELSIMKEPRAVAAAADDVMRESTSSEEKGRIEKKANLTQCDDTKPASEPRADDKGVVGPGGATADTEGESA